MRLDITGRHVDITPPLRQLIDEAARRGSNALLNDAAVSATITLTKEKYRLRTEIAVHTRGDHVLRGNGEGNAWPISVRQATDKIEQQAQTLKGKWNDGSARALAPPGGRRPSAARRAGRRAADRPGDALCRQADVGRGRGAAGRRRRRTRSSCSATPTPTSVSILYRRKDGNLGLIEPD